MRLEVHHASPIGRVLEKLCCVVGAKEVDFEEFKVVRHGWGFEITCKSADVYFDLKEVIEEINTTKTHESVIIYEYDGAVRRDSAIANIFFRLLANTKIPATVMDLYENETGRMTSIIAVIPPLVIEEMKWIPKPKYCAEYHSLVVRMLP